ncbi:OmpA family protein [uncultured Litoreibacter sp.]|uniref:OmpA family protein n=1 Tax=uncultured Litoreibacter sp. TaxID=1392394 RepID=UPI00260628AF|nr:OmpA family protein [uncultured Litoreibacter sp.]
MTLKTLGVVGAAVLSLSACDTTNFDTSNVNKSQTGAIIGGVVGGLIGASSDDNKILKGAVGAGIGAAAGGVIGHQLDKQAQDLRRDIPNEDIAIENTGSELKVTLPQALLFASDSATLDPALESDLRALAGNLNSYPDSTVRIVGHTDDTGSDSHNFDLSERRAYAVSRVLEGAGVSTTRLQPVGAGEAQPVSSNLTEEGKAQNRRVEILIRPNAA